MRRQILEKVEIPEGIECKFLDDTLKCKKDSSEIQKKMNVIGISIRAEDNSIIFKCNSGNQRDFKIIKTNIAHVKNIFRGLQDKFVYKLEACNVHFPMILKLEGDKLIINNFLGEKIPRHAKILPNVEVEVKGTNITISSNDKEAAGQTAANFEKATVVKGRDRRIFQDGIYIVEKPRRAK